MLFRSSSAVQDAGTWVCFEMEYLLPYNATGTCLPKSRHPPSPQPFQIGIEMRSGNLSNQDVFHIDVSSFFVFCSKARHPSGFPSRAAGVVFGGAWVSGCTSWPGTLSLSRDGRASAPWYQKRLLFVFCGTCFFLFPWEMCLLSFCFAEKNVYVFG